MMRRETMMPIRYSTPIWASYRQSHPMTYQNEMAKKTNVIRMKIRSATKLILFFA
jgi:hypothetical protein